MNGADEYNILFKETHQKGRLFFVVSSHARGRTFRVFVLPEGEAAIENGSSNAPLNSNSVEVFGQIGGHSGWTDFYGWIHKGKWQDDFNKYVEVLKEQKETYRRKLDKAKQTREAQEAKELERNLSNY